MAFWGFLFGTRLLRRHKRPQGHCYGLDNISSPAVAEGSQTCGRSAVGPFPPSSASNPAHKLSRGKLPSAPIAALREFDPSGICFFRSRNSMGASPCEGVRPRPERLIRWRSLRREGNGPAGARGRRARYRGVASCGTHAGASGAAHDRPPTGRSMIHPDVSLNFQLNRRASGCHRPIGSGRDDIRYCQHGWTCRGWVSDLKRYYAEALAS
jgi:hypothetical protein